MGNGLHMKKTILTTMVLILTSCSQDISPKKYRFSIDTATREYQYSVHGHASSSVSGILSSAEGARKIVYRGGKDGKCNSTVAESDWNLPPEAVMNQAGQVLICWNFLDGADTEQTLGPMPDPQNGVQLLCSFYDANCSLQINAIRIGNKEEDPNLFYPVAWLRRITAQADGTFTIEFLYESGWFSSPTLPGHGTYRQKFDPTTKQISLTERKQADCKL